MNEIRLLDKETIDKIAAGEVVERPSSIVKELLENAIDAKASCVSVEIKNGGIDLIRVTDNGSGIAKDQIPKAFMRHATSKINSADDLSFVTTLGFRGEALSSICAVSRLELCSKSKDSITGAIYKAEGSRELSLEDAGLPDGTTIIVRDLFYNVPARKKFLKSAKTEAAYISEIIEKIALSHPDISVKFINNGDVKLLTSGRGDLKDTIYSVFGRGIASSLLKVNASSDCLSVNGYIGKPEVARQSRTLENYFLNGRFIKDKAVSKALEDAYRGYQMKGTFPFSCFNIIMEPELIDVNVHPSKLEVKFFDTERVYDSVYTILSGIIRERENIPSFTIGPKAEKAEASEPLHDAASGKMPGNPENKKTDGAPPEDNYGFEPTEQVYLNAPEKEAYCKKTSSKTGAPEPFETNRIEKTKVFREPSDTYKIRPDDEKYEQNTIFGSKFISEEARPDIKLVGCVFNTYWIAEYNDQMYIIDQHAAHEKVLYEQFMERIRKDKLFSQQISPPVIISLSAPEENTLNRYMDYFTRLGFEVSHFGGREYAISAVPASLYSSIDDKELFSSCLDELSRLGNSKDPEILLDRVAAAACKAAVKGGNRLTSVEAGQLITSLLSLDNPYNCPHGRPTIITMSKYEMERKFKRII